LLEKDVPESLIEKKVNAYLEEAKVDESMIHAIADLLQEDSVEDGDAAVSKEETVIEQVEETRETVLQVTVAEK